MKLFFIGWAESCPELVDTAEALEKQGHRIVYWVRNEEPVAVDHSRFPNTAFHSYHEARNIIPSPEIPCDKFPYPDASLLKELASTELLVLPMMNKIYPGMSVSERQHLFMQFVRYWLGVIGRFGPDLIFFNTTPHAPLYFALYGLAKHLGIKTAMFDVIWISDRIIWMTDFREGSMMLRENYLRLRQKNVKMEDLPPDLREYYGRHLNPDSDTTPAYFISGLETSRTAKRFARKMRNFFSSLFKPKIFWKKIRRFYINFPNLVRKLSYYFSFNLPKAYHALQIVPDLNRKFVYVPLHMQPECTTNPIGEVFQDQIFLIQTLADSLPPDWVVYVKEHPGQWPYYGIGFTEDRYRSYYNRIARIPKVSLVPIEMRSLDLISKAQTVATVSSTAGWEAILRGKPALIFGHAWYQYAPGVIRVRNADDCRKAFDLIASGVIVFQNDTRAFLLALNSASFKGYIDNLAKETAKLTPKENMENFLGALISIFK